MKLLWARTISLLAFKLQVKVESKEYSLPQPHSLLSKQSQLKKQKTQSYYLRRCSNTIIDFRVTAVKQHSAMVREELMASPVTLLLL